MKKLYLSFGISIFLFTNVFEHGGFIRQKSKAISNNLNDVWATDAIYFVEGDYGTIINSSDYGATGISNFNYNAGSYEVEFNGSKYPSGVFFYRIQAGIYSSVKKMVLLK